MNSAPEPDAVTNPLAGERMTNPPPPKMPASRGQPVRSREIEPSQVVLERLVRFTRAITKAFARHFGAQEVTLLAGLFLLFVGVARESMSVALVVAGAILLVLAWPRRPAARSGHSPPASTRDPLRPDR